MERLSRTAFLGLGSNLGDRLGHLRNAVAALPDLTAVSGVYETDPLDTPPGPDGRPQAPYLNLVARLDTDLTPRQLLELAQRLEQDAHRIRRLRNAARTLDVDVLLVGDLTVDDPDLVVPHPRMAERRFVLAPLAEIAPDRVDPATLSVARGTVRRLGELRLLVIDPIT